MESVLEKLTISSLWGPKRPQEFLLRLRIPAIHEAQKTTVFYISLDIIKKCNLTLAMSPTIFLIYGQVVKKAPHIFDTLLTNLASCIAGILNKVLSFHISFENLRLRLFVYTCF